ncbi:hypothetical protein IQ255_02740 [Pleurocapsales cyanobacterium LEGE 10410]|nr:hypothetical protein [Pleurocapsales cyanobacterium LEGE 10410]
MSPRKLTEDDKQEILHLYRNSEATTSTLATSYEVSSSTISRFLKNKLSSSEYEDLIQQKRLARTPRGEKSSDSSQKTKTKTKTKTKAKAKAKIKKKSQPKVKQTKTETATEILSNDTAPRELKEQNPIAPAEPTSANVDLPRGEAKSEEPKRIPRRRRRSSAISELIAETIAPEAQPEIEELYDENEAEQKPAKLVLDKKTSSAEDSADSSKSDRLILKSDRLEPEEDEEDDAMDLITLKEMLGEDLEDINDDEDEDEDDDWEQEESASYPDRRTGLSDIQILPLSQASFPRTCYLVIDRSAELIVKPLADFADLGAIPEEEVRQRTLPIFDNHRIAKRFSHRRERVIKVPDGRMLQKTSHHLQDKGITRLLMDGQVYSLSN